MFDYNDSACEMKYRLDISGQSIRFIYGQYKGSKVLRIHNTLHQRFEFNTKSLQRFLR